MIRRKFLVLFVLPVLMSHPVMGDSIAGVCPIVNGEEREAAHSLESGRVNQQHTSRRQTCRTSLGSILPVWKRGGTVIVDVRAAGEYERHHIPGSINIPLLSLSKKPFLRGKNLILVNSGHGYNALERACASLKENGFNGVKILEGGLLEWVERGQPITGSLAAATSMFRNVGAKDFYSGLMDSSWQVINATKKSEQELGVMFPQANVVGMATALTSLDKGEFETQSGIIPQRFLLVTDSGEAYDRLAKPFLKKRLGGFFYLKDGFEAYSAYIHKHKAIIERAKRGPVRYTKCSLQ